jgi:hypothetical protein
LSSKYEGAATDPVDTVYCVQGTRTNQYGRHVPCCDDGLHRYFTSLKKQKHEYHGLRKSCILDYPYLWNSRDVCVQPTKKKLNASFRFVVPALNTLYIQKFIVIFIVVDIFCHTFNISSKFRKTCWVIFPFIFEKFEIPF